MSDEKTSSVCRDQRADDARRRWWAPLAIVLFAAVAATPAFAQDAPADEVLLAGAEVYSVSCSQCHQPGGAGLPGTFPPLRDNPNVDDAEYIRDVIRNGLDGPIMVNDEPFDSVMPPQSTLGDDDVDAVIAYIQSGFAAPAIPEHTANDARDGGTGLPSWAGTAFLATLLGGLVLLSVTGGPRLLAANDRRSVTWLDAWTKTGAIAVAVVVLTVYLPSKVLELGTVKDLPREAQDLTAVGIWSVGLGTVLLGLWYAHRKNRI